MQIKRFQWHPNFCPPSLFRSPMPRSIRRFKLRSRVRICSVSDLDFFCDDFKILNFKFSLWLILRSLLRVNRVRSDSFVVSLIFVYFTIGAWCYKYGWINSNALVKFLDHFFYLNIKKFIVVRCRRQSRLFYGFWRVCGHLGPTSIYQCNIKYGMN